MGGPASRAPAAASTTTIDLLRTLVGFDTTSRNSNLALIDFVAATLRDQGVTSEFTYDHDRKKANLFATIGAGSRPGLILSGHTDVVPVDGQDWTSDPFTLVERDGSWYGRGACDMKGFIAVILGKVGAIRRADLRTPIHFALSYDEEVGCLGVRSLLASLTGRDLPTRGCIVGEPTSMVPVTAHKGKRGYHCHVRGKAAHSSMVPIGVNAVEHAADLILHLRAMAHALERGAQEDGFDVPYTTLTTTTIAGGNATNTIPADCNFSFEYRFLPGSDPDLILTQIQDYIRCHIEPAMHRVDSTARVELDEIIAYPPLKDENPAELITLVRRWSAATTTRKVAFGTEAGLFSEAGIAAVVCGPGDIRHAHRPDEHVTTAQLACCEYFIDGVIADLAAEDRVLAEGLPRG